MFPSSKAEGGAQPPQVFRFQRALVPGFLLRHLGQQFAGLLLLAQAQAAIPQCNLTFLTGQEMRAALEGYYAVLFRTDPASIGGGMPYDAFYYGGE